MTTIIMTAVCIGGFAFGWMACSPTVNMWTKIKNNKLTKMLTNSEVK